MKSVLVGLASLTILALTMQQAGATFPGDNGKLAFTIDGQIHVIDPDGSGHEQVTSDGHVGFDDAEWSPDGSRFVYASDGLFVMDADGSNPTLILRRVSRGVEVSQPSWSPDGTKIVFATTGTPNVRRVLYVINVDGSGLKKITRGRHQDVAPKWSPDGTRVVLSSWSGGFFSPGPVRLVTMRPNGSHRRALVSRGSNYSPDWSPDGSRIVFTRYRQATGNSDVFAIDRNGSGRVRLTDTPHLEERSAVFSPDGNRIAFLREMAHTNVSNIFSMLADGTDEVRVTDTIWEKYGLSWQAT